MPLSLYPSPPRDYPTRPTPRNSLHLRPHPRRSVVSPQAGPGNPCSVGSLAPAQQAWPLNREPGLGLLDEASNKWLGADRLVRPVQDSLDNALALTVCIAPRYQGGGSCLSVRMNGISSLCSGIMFSLWWSFRDGGPFSHWHIGASLLHGRRPPGHCGVGQSVEGWPGLLAKSDRPSQITLRCT